jgi:lipopolysaccharide export LptBFGC system permease protein LptF
MDQKPDPLDKKRVMRAGIAGMLLAGAGVLLFILLWIVLGSTGMTQFPRLLLALCIPPALIAAVVGIYFLRMQGR